MSVLLVSCGKKMDDFTDNLGSKYSIDNLSSSEIDGFADGFDFDADDYSVEDVVVATNKKTYCMVVIIECGSKKEAKELVEDADDIVDALKDSFSSIYSFKAVNEGKFVLIGENSAIKDALDK
jgi:hypothetical protein